MNTWDDYKKTMVAPPTLWSAAKENDLAQLEALLAAGHDLNALDHRGYSVLMGAAFKGHVAIVQRLLEAGADRSIKNASGLDVRALTLVFGRTEVIELLDRTERNVIL